MDGTLRYSAGEVVATITTGTDGTATGEPLYLGKFEIKETKAPHGMAIPKDGLIEIASCDENGKAVFATDLPVGAKLYVKEYSTDEHYLISDEIYPVEFAYAGQETAVVNISVNDGQPMENKLIRGSVIGKKIDEDGFAICGAIFGLF